MERIYNIGVRIVTGVAITQGVRMTANYLFPGLWGISMVGDMFQMLNANNYDPSTCLGRFNICYQHCIPGNWLTAGACVAGCSAAYGVCKWLGGA